MFGGTTAVSQTQKQQMIIIMGGLVAAFIVLVSKFPADISVGDAVTVAGKMGKLEIIDLKFDPHDRYNIWTAIFGGTFLFLSYFGTDQSQVSRYLSGKSLTESRLGLLFNGIFKVPMQFMILFVGLMVFMFYQFEKPPIHFNPSNVERISASPKYQAELDDYQMDYDLVYNEKQSAIRNLLSAIEADDATLTAEIQGQLVGLDTQDKAIRSQVDDLLTWIEQEDQSIAKIDTDDGDYIFITFVMQHLPIGLIGLLLAVIFSAAMSSTASELNALASCTIVDFYRRSLGDRRSDSHYLQATKLFTLIWGAAALLFAGFASLFDNLIEFVNIIGSLFYGTILGIFVIAFFFRKIQSNATLMAAIVGEIVVVTVFILDRQGVVDIAYLWLNLIGCVVVITTAAMLSLIFKRVTS
jgi:Na+/proline symporter